MTTIGVKQGGPLSPRLFAIYIEKIVEIIDESGLGIEIGNLTINILLYADDIVLLAKNPADMQHMINLVETFGNSLEVKFNPTKTNYMVINGHLKQHQYLLNNALKMNDLGIEMVSTMKYLGNIVSKTLSNTDHISNRIRLTAAAMFKLNDCGYDESLDAMTIIQLYKTYGRTTLLYGLENLNLNIGETERVSTFEKTYQKIIKIRAISP
jgi:hypothetical protein